MAQDKKAKKARRKRIGIFVYCTAEMRKKLKDAARESGQTLSGYVLTRLRAAQ